MSETIDFKCDKCGESVNTLVEYRQREYVLAEKTLATDQQTKPMRVCNECLNALRKTDHEAYSQERTDRITILKSGLKPITEASTKDLFDNVVDNPLTGEEKLKE